MLSVSWNLTKQLQLAMMRFGSAILVSKLYSPMMMMEKQLSVQVIMSGEESYIFRYDDDDTQFYKLDIRSIYVNVTFAFDDDQQLSIQSSKLSHPYVRKANYVCCGMTNTCKCSNVCLLLYNEHLLIEISKSSCNFCQ